MMSVQLLQTLSLVAFILAGVMFLVAVALFFLFNVPKLYGEVSGATARKAIESIRQQNEESGNKAYRPSPVNASRGKLTDKISPSGRIEVKHNSSAISVGTSKLSTSELIDTTASETVLLEVDSGATTLLSSDNEYISDNVADVVNANIPEAPHNIYDNVIQSGVVTLEVDINYLGSSEIIE